MYVPMVDRVLQAQGQAIGNTGGWRYLDLKDVYCAGADPEPGRPDGVPSGFIPYFR